MGDSTQLELFTSRTKECTDGWIDLAAELGHPGMNPRVILFAKDLGFDPMNLQRESIADPQYEVEGAPWTLVYKSWVKNKRREFHIRCHGDEEVAGCCASAMIDGSFDQWLLTVVL